MGSGGNVTFSDFLDEDQQDWRETCHRFIDEQITREYVRDCDMDRRYYSEGYAKLAANGFLGLLIPEEHGGSGGTTLAYAVLCEAMGKYGVDFAVAACVSTFSAMNLIHYGSEEQIKRFIPRFIDGSVSFCVAISEPEAGSDAAATSTRAVRDGDHYVLTGLKQWCSGSSAPGAHLFTLVRTDPAADKHTGLSVVLLPNDLPGMELRKLKTLARRATGTNQVFLDGARAPLDSLIGAEGQGWEIITRHLLLERIAIAAAYVGCAQQAVDDACQYALERKQFGQAIFGFQALNHMLADMQTKVDAARLLVYRAGAMADTGSLAAREVAMAKLFASEALQSVSRDGVQIMGGAGMLPEADMERYFREGMQATIGGGTSQIQRNIIARSMGRRPR
jgi:alkylation response protein AidB-like acyl-CoA dehydrogenase